MAGFVGAHARKRRRNLFITLVFVTLIAVIITKIPSVRKIFRRLFLAREPTKPAIYTIYLLIQTCQRYNINYAQDLDLMHRFFL